MAIWQDLVSEDGFASSYQSVQRFVRNRRGTQTPEARVVIVTASDQEAHALGLRGNAPLLGCADARATLRTSGDFGRLTSWSQSRLQNRLKSSSAGEASALRSRHRFAKGQALP